MSLEIAVPEEELMDFVDPDAEMNEAQTETAKVDNKEVTDDETKTTAATGSAITIFDVFDLPKDLDTTSKFLGDIRLNTVHVLGVQEMSTEDVEKYFTGYDVIHLEWINDKAVNVVFDDFTKAAAALIGVTSHLLVEDDEAAERIANNSLVPCMKISSLEDLKVPSGSKWVLGKECPKSSRLLLRLATKSDKKERGAGKFSEYYRKYGNPHYGGKKNLMSSSLAEKLKKLAEEGGGEIEMEPPSTNRFDDEAEEEEKEVPRRPLGLRMRMRADDEEEKNPSKSPKKSIWERLDKDNNKPSILDRLGKKSIGISRDRTSSKSGLSVWSRLSLNPDGDSPRIKEEASSSSSNRSVLYSNIRRRK